MALAMVKVKVMVIVMVMVMVLVMLMVRNFRWGSQGRKRNKVGVVCVAMGHQSCIYGEYLCSVFFASND